MTLLTQKKHQPDFKTPVKRFVDKLVFGDYQGVIGISFDKERQKAQWIAEEIKTYPGQMTFPPESAYQHIEVYPYDDGSGFRLDFALWFNHKKSDLEIKINAIRVDDELYFTLWDVLVP